MSKASSILLAGLLGPTLLLIGVAAAPGERAPAPGRDHGRVAWFEGTFEQALAEATRAKKIVFIDFWASWCGWCKRLDRETLADNTVVAETQDLVCLSIDAESQDGQPLAARYGVAGLPALVFLEPGGSLRDRLAGFRPPAQFVAEVRRVKSGEGTLGGIEKRIAANPKDAAARLDLVLRLRQLHEGRWEREIAAVRELIQGGEGFDPKSPDERFAIARKLRMCSDEKGYQDQIAAIRALDPESRSFPMRRLALDDLLQAVNARYQKEKTFDPGAVKTFLAGERHAQVRFEGWSSLRAMSSYQAEEQARRGQMPMAAGSRAEARACGREAWKSCPADRVATFGRELAQSFLAQDRELTDEERGFAVEVALKASETAPKNVDHLETLAACLELAGRKEEAVAALRRALEIEPGKAALKARLESLQR